MAGPSVLRGGRCGFVVRPNLLLGVFGAVVFLLAGSIIVGNWRALTDTRDYEVLVDPSTTPLSPRSASMGASDARTETFRVTQENVTRVFLRLTWQESSTLGAQHNVTLTLRNPQGDLVAKEGGQGGVSGISIDQTVGETPVGGRFTARPDEARERFESEYPPHPESVGDWTARIETNMPSQPGASGITYTLNAEITHYAATLREAAPLAG